MPSITCRLCGPAGFKNAHARHAGSATCRPAAARARGAASDLRPATVPSRMYRDGHVVPAPGDKLQEAPRRARSHRQKQPQAGVIDPVRAVHALPAHGRSCLVPLGFFMSETMHPTRQ